MPKDRRPPQLPNATPTHVVEDLLTLAVIEPTFGCRQYADRLAERGYRVGKTTVQKLLVDHGLGRRAQRVARAAAITAATTGLSTDAAREARAVRVLPLQPSSRRPGGDGQLLHRQPQRRRQGVPADRHRRRHPLGDHADRHRPGHRRPHDPLHRPRHAQLPTSRRVGAGRAHRQRTRVDRRRVPGPPRPRASPITASRRAHRTTTPCANASKAPPCRSAGGPPSTAAASPASASSRPKPTPGSSATTTVAATTATTCAAAHQPRSSTTTVPAKHHDHQPQGPPPVTSTPGREGLGCVPPSGGLRGDPRC